MKHFLQKKSFFLLISILIINTFVVYSQNTYLSFNEGSKGKQDGVETMPTRTYQSLKSSNLEIGYTFTGAYVAETEVEKTLYNFLHIEGFAKMTQVGAPALPAHNDIIAIPKGATGEIVLLEKKYYEYDGYMVYPTLKPARDTEGAPSPEFEKDDAVYTKNEFFPKNVVEIVDVSINRGTVLATAQIRPVQFNPVTGKIRVYTNIKYRLEASGGEGSFDYISKENTLHYTNLLKRNVLNSESIPDGFSSEDQKKNKSGAKNYIIITHSEYLSQANELANWKRQLGYSVEVVSQSNWTAAEVKTEVYNRYISWTPKPDYFVIIGDHTGSFAVPGEIHQDPSDGEDFATDLYAACMDGGSDHVADMAHGRISVSSAAEATIVINKIINYEKTPTTNTDYYNNVLNCAQYQDVENSEAADGFAARRFCHTSEEIRDYLQGNYSYTSTRVYYTSTTWDVADLHYNDGRYSDGQFLPAELRDASFNWNGGSADITSAIDAGKFMVFHRDHGYVGGSGWAHPYYSTSSMTGLANGDKLPIVFSMNCHTGEFQLDNCFAEKFLRMENKGAVGVVGAAYYSYSGYNDALSAGMIDAIWSNPGLFPDFGYAGTGGSYTVGAGNDIYTMGDVVNQGLFAMVQNYGDDTYTHELFHYFGDPAMKIWTMNPNDNAITASHNTTIDCAGTTFSVTGSTANALATLVYNNELIAETVLDGSGNGTLTYSITEPGTVVILTISKYNQKPYTSDLSITGTCSFPPSVESDASTSITTSSATLNGEITNDYGFAVSESGFVYSSTLDPVIGGTGVSQIQTDPLVTTGIFSEDISGLSVNTKYYCKAYAINTNGTSYGDCLSFTTECNVPATQASNLAITSVDENDITISWTSSGDYVLVLAKEGSTVDSNPISGVSYNANSDFTLGEDLGSGCIVVYCGTEENITITNLIEDTDYHFAIYKYNDSEKCYNIINPATGTATTAPDTNCALASLPFSEDFENYNNGDFVADNSLIWNTWSNAPATNEDANISIDFASGGSNSMLITGSNDMVLPLCNVTSGSYQIDFKLFIESGYGAYFNFQHILASEYAMQTFFGDNGIGKLQVENRNNYFEFVNDSWIQVTAMFNLDNNYAQLMINNKIVHTWYFNSITSGYGGTTQLGAINFYAAAGDDLTPKYYVDDVNIITAPACSNPTTSANSLTVSAISHNAMQVNLTRGDGDRILVLAKEGSAVDADPSPTIRYFANKIFTYGSEIGTGNYVVYDGSADNFYLEGLNEGLTYHFAIYEYNAWNCYYTPAATISGTTNSCNTIIEILSWTEDFNSGTISETAVLDCWSNFIEAGTRNWIGKYYGTEDNYYAQITAYNSGEKTNVAWLISPTINFDNYDVEKLTFRTRTNYYVHDGLSVWISNDYNKKNPLDATWTELSATFATGPDNGYGEWVESGEVDLSMYSGNAHIAFKYIGSSYNGQSTTYQIDDITIKSFEDIELAQVYTLGKLPIDYGTPHIISALLINRGESELNDIDVTLNITGDNPFTDVKNVGSLYKGDSTTIFFNGYSPTIEGTQLVDVAISNDDDLGNNSLTKNITTTLNSYSYAQGDIPDGGVGFGGATGDFVAKFNTSLEGALNQVDVEFNNEGREFQIGIWDATGVDGTPGNVLYTSATQVSSEGNYTLLIDPAISIPTGDFYVGVRQVAETNVGFAYQWEEAIRENTFYYTSPTGETTWADFAPGSLFRLMIEPKFAVSNDVSVASVNSDNGKFGVPLDIDVEVINYGSISQSDIPVYYSVEDGDEIGPLTIAGPIEANETASGVFNNSLAYTPDAYGSFNVDVYTKLANDQAAENDTISFVINVPLPEIIISGLINDFGNVQTGSYSSVQSYTVYGNNLIDDIEINAPTGFEISLDNSDFSINPITLIQSGGEVLSTLVYLRFAPTEVQLYSDLVIHTSTDANEINVDVTGSGVAPTITTSDENLEFGDVETGTSVVQSYTVKGSFLLDNLTITASTGFEISLDNSDFSVNPITLVEAGGIIETTTIYVRFTPTLEQVYSDNITNISSGASQVDVTVSGNGVASGTAIITKSITNLDFGDIILNTVSAEKSYTVSGNNLTADIIVTAPEGFEISLDNSDYSVNPITLSQSGGIVATTTIYIRFTPTTVVEYSGVTLHESTGANTANVSVKGNTICENLIVTGSDNQTICEGGTAIFTVLVSGSETITYVWKKGTDILSDGGDISGASTNSITIANIESSDAGDYKCEITDACGNMEIAEANLSVPTVANITSNPTSISLCTGEEAQFNVVAEGDGLFYQWRKGSANIGGNSATLVIPDVTSDDAGEYTCVISGTCGDPVTSSIAVLDVNTSTVSISNQPQNVTVCKGKTARFEIVAIDAISYQWLKDGSYISDATTNTYIINSVTTADEGDYACIAYDDCGSEISTKAALNVNLSSVLITGQPEGKTVCEGENVTFMVTATGATSYQWQKDGSDISGATSNSYIINSVSITDEGDYSCIAFDNCGSVTSTSAILNVNTSLVVITKQPESASICFGDEAIFSIIATNASSYQWQKDGVDITGITSDTYKINAAVSSDAGVYTCIVSDNCGSITSTSATLNVNISSVEITLQPETVVACLSDEVAFNIVASDATNYQWQKDGEDISGATSDTYTINSVEANDVGDYICIAYDACGSVTSNKASLSLNLSTEITTQPVDINANVGDDVSFNTVADGTNLTYQWCFNGTNIEGEEAATCQIVSVSEDNVGNYTVVVSGECGDITSEIAVLSVTTSIDNLTDYGINIYPNPSEGVFNISYSKNIENVEVTIINFGGQIVYQENHNSKTNIVDISDKAQGPYLIKFKYERKSIMSRIILL